MLLLMYRHNIHIDQNCAHSYMSSSLSCLALFCMAFSCRALSSLASYSRLVSCVLSYLVLSGHIPINPNWMQPCAPYLMSPSLNARSLGRQMKQNACQCQEVVYGWCLVLCLCVLRFTSFFASPKLWHSFMMETQLWIHISGRDKCVQKE